MTFRKIWSEEMVNDNINSSPSFMKQAILDLYNNGAGGEDIKGYARFIFNKGQFTRYYAKKVRFCLSKYKHALVKILNKRYSA